MSTMPSVTLKPGKEAPILAGHPWVFSNAMRAQNIARCLDPALAPSPTLDSIPAGSLVQVLSSDEKCLGIGTYNPHTNIRIRMLSRDPQEQINESFFIKKFLELDTWKKKHLPPNTNGYRLVHAETDGLPGLIVDRYADTFVFQIHTAGMELLRGEIISALTKTFSPTTIVERSDLQVRKREGLKTAPVTVHLGSADKPVTFMENGITFFADTLKGQKTGFFLDQRDARYELGKLSNKKRVLNLFCYTGGFSVYAAISDASFVTSIDSSADALAMAKNNFQANQLNPNDTSHFAFENMDIFEMIKRKTLPHGPYDIIICDPPALAKKEDDIRNARRAYGELNQYCLSKLSPGGVLVTSSCSGRITQEDFRDILRISAGRARKIVKILKWISQPADHAELLGFDEGRYLKTAILEVIG